MSNCTGFFHVRGPALTISLSELPIGVRARIKALPKTDLAYRARLMAMGFTVGAEILIKRIAALGDPIEVIVRGVHMSLRRQEASELQLERIDV
jgi:ferrous iron transport protein A